MIFLEGKLFEMLIKMYVYHQALFILVCFTLTTGFRIKDNDSPTPFMSTYGKERFKFIKVFFKRTRSY